MSASGVTYFLAVCFWTLTAAYGVLASQPFVQQQFLGPRLFPPLVAFTDWHPEIGLLLLAAWSAARRHRMVAVVEKRTWATAVIWLTVTVLQMVAAPLSGPQATAAARLTIIAGLSLVLLLALTDLRRLPATPKNSQRDRSRADLLACLLSAAIVTFVYAGATTWLDGVSQAFAADILQSLRLHLLIAAVAFLTLAAVRAMAALTPRPVSAESVLCSATLAAVLAGFLTTSVLPSISIRGLLATALGLGFAVALACAMSARGAVARTGEDGVLRAFSPLAPAMVTRWWGFALWLACLFALAVVAITATRTVDWSFVLLRSAIVVTWLLTLAAALTVSQRFSDGGARPSFAFVTMLLCGHVLLQSAVAPVQASTLKNASGKWLAELLEGTVRLKSSDEFVRFLHAHTNIPRDTQVDAVDVNLAELSGFPGTVRPHIFVFVVDSLRRDYLSPYNPQVTFTPGIGELAQDSLVFNNAFTQYGATGLSVPSIWVGAPILHKQYVASFARMNSLAKLLVHEQYEPWIGADHIMNTILPRFENRVPLDSGVRVKDFRMCKTLAEIRSRLAGRSSSPPVFAYSLPQDVHISVLTREGARAIDERSYEGFYAPVASRVRRLDECLSQFVRDLKALGLYEHSVIVLTSDHGDSLGEDGRMGHAYSLHPEIVRVPLIVHLPPGLRHAWSWDENRPAYTTDITPTLYRLLGHEPTAPAPFFGESLALQPGRVPAAPKDRMVAASYGAVYGALLDHATQYYVFDAISMREMQFDLGKGSVPREVPVTPDTQEEGRKAIRETVSAISRFYQFSTARDSAP